jgi:four helix bundle protein
MAGHGRDIEDRTFRFAVRVVRLCQAAPASFMHGTVTRQLLRAGTSVGANVEEAQGAHSKADFIRRMNIARAESREALYWLRLIRETGMLPPEKLSAIIAEADEITRILIAIVKNARKGVEGG